MPCPIFARIKHPGQFIRMKVGIRIRSGGNNQERIAVI